MARSTREKKKRKAIQFQLGWSGLIALLIATVAALLWTFVLGFWIGQKLVGQSGSTNMVAGSLTGKNASSGALPGVGGNELTAHQSRTASPPAGDELTIPTLGEKSGEAALKTEIVGNGNKTDVEETPPVNRPEMPSRKSFTGNINPSTRAMRSKVSKKATASVKKVHFVLQIASYRSKDRAEREAQRWRKKGYRITVKKADLGAKGIWYRIYLGQFKTVSDATGFARQFAKKEGLRSYVVPVK